MPEKLPIVKPMLATLAREPFDSKDWLYEIKWDGYRIVATVENGKVTLHTRELQDYTPKYKIIADELSGLQDCIIDGEMVVLDSGAKPDISALQNYHGQGNIVY